MYSGIFFRTFNVYLFFQALLDIELMIEFIHYVHAHILINHFHYKIVKIGTIK